MKREINQTLNTSSFDPFILDELMAVMNYFKPGKTFSLDEISNEIFANFEKTRMQLLQLFNTCALFFTITRTR